MLGGGSEGGIGGSNIQRRGGGRLRKSKEQKIRVEEKAEKIGANGG